MGVHHFWRGSRAPGAPFHIRLKAKRHRWTHKRASPKMAMFAMLSNTALWSWQLWWQKRNGSNPENSSPPPMQAWGHDPPTSGPFQPFFHPPAHQGPAKTSAKDGKRLRKLGATSRRSMSANSWKHCLSGPIGHGMGCPLLAGRGGAFQS